MINICPIEIFISKLSALDEKKPALHYSTI